MRASAIVTVLVFGLFALPLAAQEELFFNGFEPGNYPWYSCSGCPSPGGCFEIDRDDPWAGAIDPDFVTLNRYANDSSLGAVEAAAATLPSGSSQSVYFWVEQVTVATVGHTANPGSFHDFWVADATAAMRVYLSSGLAVHPGD
ncbi:MAG: hypothetical protein V2I67_05810 [Thermoanaerobaculales bacterium]|jgi:hypothetical protein|nr:hypothetical protein [Thermoanaerobaculales bacterium]